MMLEGKIGREIRGDSTTLAVAGFVLAGGNSRRMGRDKALLQRVPGGPTFLEHAAHTVEQAVGNVIIIGPPERYANLRWPVLADLHPGLGPIGGLETILKTSPRDWNLAVACDMPFVSRQLLHQLIDSVTSENGDCVVSQDSSGQLHPLCALYHRRCLPVLEQMISDKCFTLHKLLDKLRVTSVLIGDKRLLHNVNQPSDLPNPESR